MVSAVKIQFGTFELLHLISSFSLSFAVFKVDTVLSKVCLSLEARLKMCSCLVCAFVLSSRS